MCDFSLGFRLCTCADEQALDPQRDYTWTLFRVVGERKAVGKYKLPVNDLGSGLAVDFVENQLNTINCFDFDYTPQEGDNLVLRSPDSLERMEFIYHNGRWEKGHLPSLRYVKERYREGMIQE